MTSSADFSVRFGKVARTLEYHDSEGTVVFTFDGSAKGPKHMVLEHLSARKQQVPRYREAFERSKQYLESCGYQVEVFGDFASPVSMQASDVSRLIQSELASQSKIADFGFDLADCLVKPRRSVFRCFPENTAWELWVVLQEPRHGLQVVFDEFTKQFGVAQRDIFDGFYGTFIQTLDAISKAG